MEKNIQNILLYDIYGNLLTKKQQQIFDLYYLSDLSLREISENIGISFQAVRDSIKTSEKLLNEYEKNIKMLSTKSSIKDIIDYLEKQELNEFDKKIYNKLKKLI